MVNRQTIAHACAHARRLGVQMGMTLAHARALVSDAEPTVLEHDPDADERALKKLAKWAMRLAPRVAVDLPDGLLMDVSGCKRLYHGECNLLNQLIEVVDQLGFTATAAIAPTFGAAWALARYGLLHNPIIECFDEIPQALAPLPVRALRLEEPVIEALNEVGIHYIGQLLQLPRQQLVSRFDHDLTCRIDQAFGQAVELIHPVCVMEPIIEQWCFAGPIQNIETIYIAARQLLERLAGQLLQREAGVEHLRVTLDRYEATPQKLHIVVSRPTRDVQHLWQLLHPKLERVNLGYGLEAIEMQTMRQSLLAHHQEYCDDWVEDQADHGILNERQGRLIDTLTHRLGYDRVVRAQTVESYCPERCFRFIPIHGIKSSREDEVCSSDRPIQLFDPPERVNVQALTPDGPVMQIRWRGKLQQVTHCIGPERLTSEWWREPTGERDYFRAQLESGRFIWLYRDAAIRQWFVHGWWV